MLLENLEKPASLEKINADTSAAWWSKRKPGCGIAIDWTENRFVRSLFAVSAGGSTWTVPHRRSSSLSVEGPRLGRRSDARAGDIRAACWNLHGSRHIRCGGRRLGRSQSVGHHVDRTHACRRISRSMELGLRRRGTLCVRAQCTAMRRRSSDSSTRRTRVASESSRRGLQSFGPGWQLPPGLQRRVFHRSLQERLGSGH